MINSIWLEYYLKVWLVIFKMIEWYYFIFFSSCLVLWNCSFCLVIILFGCFSNKRKGENDVSIFFLEKMMLFYGLIFVF